MIYQKGLPCPKCGDADFIVNFRYEGDDAYGERNSDWVTWGKAVKDQMYERCKTCCYIRYSLPMDNFGLTENLASVGKALRRFRKVKGMTEVAVAKAAGISRTTMRAWEHDVNKLNKNKAFHRESVKKIVIDVLGGTEYDLECIWGGNFYIGGLKP